MEEWKEYKLGDLYEVHNGLSKGGNFFGSGYPFLSFSTVFKNFFLPPSLDSLVQTSEKERSNFDIKRGDVFITRTSETAEELGMSSVALNDYPDATYNGFTKRLRPINGENVVVPEYIGYYLRSPKFRSLFYGLSSSMSTRASLANGDLLNMKVNLPSLKEQKRISSILKSLDDKIENNRKINENLEQQAQALFKSWFVDFEPFRDQPFVESELGMIPEGWRVGTLFDVAEIFDKQRRPLSGKEREGMKRLYPYYGATSCMDFVDNYLFDGIYTLIGEDGSVTKENGLPYMQYVWGKFWVNNHAHILQGKKGFSTEMIHVFLSMTNIQHLVTGAVQAKLSQANMQKIVLVIPPMNVLNHIRPIIDSLYAIRREKEAEFLRLSHLRDTLLPKLMSGEIKL